MLPCPFRARLLLFLGARGRAQCSGNVSVVSSAFGRAWLLPAALAARACGEAPGSGFLAPERASAPGTCSPRRAPLARLWTLPVLRVPLFRLPAHAGHFRPLLTGSSGRR